MSARTLPSVGTLVKDTATDKTGEFMGMWAGQALLRPEGGGREWDADPNNLVPAEGASRGR